MIKKCLIYARVSFEGKKEEKLSPDVQVNIAKETIKSKGWILAEPAYVDRNKTGTNTNRDGFQNMLTRCKDGGINAVVVQDTSRLSRNTREYLAMKTVLKDYGVEIVSVNQPMANKDDPYAEFIDEITASVNALQPRVTSMKVKLTMDAKFEFGWWPGPAFYGYQNTENPNPACPLDKKIITPEPEISLLIIKTFKLYSTGNYSFSKLCRAMCSKGLSSRTGNKMMSVSSMQHMISNPFYYGLMRRNGKEKMGNHKPLISKALFDQCQFVAAKNRCFVTRERKYKYLLRGHAFCLIHNKGLTAEPHKINSRKNKVLSWYHCTQVGGCPGSYIESKLLENRVANLFKRFEFSPDFIELVRQKIKANIQEGRKTIKSERRGILNKRKAVEAKRNSLEDLIVAGTINKDTYERQHTKFQGEINQCDSQLLDLEAEHQIDTNLVGEVLALTRNIYQTYIDAPYYLKKLYLSFFFEGIYIKDKRIARVVETPLFSTLRRQNKVIIRNNWLCRVDSSLTLYRKFQ